MIGVLKTSQPQPLLSQQVTATQQHRRNNMAYLLDLYVIATSVVSIASILCNYTDTPKDNSWVAKAYKVLEQFAFLGNKAKQ